MKNSTLRKLLFTCLFFAFTYSGIAQCNYSIRLTDSFGDGWNDGKVTVFVNGIPVLVDLTILGGSGPESHIFLVNVGDDVTTTYTAGMYAGENEYSILNSDGIIVAQEGQSGTPGNVLSGTITGECPSCAAPYNLAANNVDDSSADLTWQENGTATSWNLEYGPQGFTQGTGTMVSGLHVTNYTLSDLNQSTTYTFFVQSDCGSEQSSWNGPINFTTITPPLTNPSACEVNIPIGVGFSNCLDAYIDVNGLYGTQLGTDILVDKMNIIIEHADVSDITFSLTTPNQVTLPISYWHGTGANYGIIDGTCTQYTSFSMAGPDGDIANASSPFVGDYIPDNNFNSWYDGSDPNGMWRLRVCIDPNGAPGHLQYVGIEFDDLAAPQADILINEIDVDQVSDTLEFVELYDGGVGNVSLNGYTVAFYNGSSNQIYNSFDLDGYSTNAEGYFVLGNASVPSVDLVFANGNLQDGADAVALYTNDASNLPVGTPVTLSNLTEAIVYGTGDATDADLIPLLNAGQLQFDEDNLGNKKKHSCSRLPNGSGGLRNTDSYASSMPTPGAENIGVPTVQWIPTTFTEDLSNNGTIGNPISVVLENNDFALSGILTETTHYTAANIPSGLTLEIEILTDTTAEAHLNGVADSHIESDDINNLNITFTDAIYNTYPSSLVINNSYDLSVDFFDTAPPTLLWSGDTFTEDNIADDGSINTSIDLELISETFATATGNIYAFTTNNVPSGLSVEIIATDNTHATVTLIGNATNHDNVDDINNLEIAFVNTAFSGNSAANVAGSSNTNLIVDFIEILSTETDILSFSFPEQTGPASIDANNHTVDIEVANGTNVFSLTAIYALSDGANAFVASNPQTSGNSINNFGLPVTYNIVAEDGTTNQDWIITVDIATGISSLGVEDRISVYPNPSTGTVQIRTKDLNLYKGLIVNTSGQVLKTFEFKNHTQLDLSSYSKGMYWIKMYSNAEVINQKVILK